MKYKITFAVLSFLSYNLHAQKSPTAIITAKDSNIVAPTPVVTPPIASPVEDEHIETPTIGLGVGVLSYYGNIKNNTSKSPLNGRIASELYVSQRISDCFSINFDVLFGKVGANERSTIPSQNANFESEIRSGSVAFVYDFGNLLPAGRNATPFISFGFSSFEFLSKTDLKDKNGNTYYYWTDGTIRNIAQNAPNAANAVLLTRDYTYESDVRNTTLQQLGKYPEYSFAIPVGIGFAFRINNFITFKMSNTMYFTFTDKIDGVIQNNSGRFLSKFDKNDNFMMTSCGLSYNFRYKPKVIIKEFEGFKNENIDFTRIDKEDQDKDGIPDIRDSCANTPAGVVVDSLGCPLDDDKDGIPNYKDIEIRSIDSAIVNTKGAQLTDAEIADAYEHYRNETMKYAAVENLEVIKTGTADKFYVSIGTYEKADFMKLPAKFVSDTALTQIKITETKSRYLMGSYDYADEAEKIKAQLKSEGIDSARVMVKQNGDYSYVEPTILIIPAKEVQTDKKENTQDLKTNQISAPPGDDASKKEGGKPNEFIEKLKRWFLKQKSQ